MSLKFRRFVTTLFLPLLLFWASCASQPQKPKGELLVEQRYNVPAQNSPEMMKHATVILVSIDGYRADYNALFLPPNLRDLEHSGVSAKSLRPPYPSKTFPSHYSISTGLTPAHHGFVSNEFYDPSLKASFAVTDSVATKDGRWCLGETIWSLAETAGLRTASYMWVGSEANIKGVHPNTYFQFSSEAATSDRVDKALAWMKLPQDVRPHLILIYFPTVDMTAHRFGTRSPQIREAVRAVDEQIGRLREGLKPYHDVNLIVLSDHGMQDVDPAKSIFIDESLEVAALLPKFKVFGRGPQMQFYLNDGEDKALIGKLKTALDAYARKEHKPFRVLKDAKDFRALKYGPTPRTGDLVIDPDIPWLVGLSKQPPALTGANHGWNPKSPAMQGIFYAEGPAFRAPAMLGTVDNVNVAPLVLKLLGLPIPKGLDGQLSVLSGALKR